MIASFDSASLPVSRWRNGGGETREVVSWPATEENFDWRVSIATIASDGDFSSFPGVDRIITLLHGDGVTLFNGERERQKLQTWQPFSFAGEEPITARLNGGVNQDFNMMTRRDRWQAQAGVSARPFQSAPGSSGVVWVLSGKWLWRGKTFGEEQGLWWSEDSCLLTPVGEKALLLWGVFTPRSISRGL